MFSLPKDTEITLDLLATLIDKHKKMVSGRYEPLLDLYTSEHEILNQPKKPDYKPDNRIVVNFAKYMVDTMNGFFLGNDIKITSDNKETEQYVSYLNRYSDQDNNNSELSKICSIYGKGYEMYYTDESSEVCIIYLDPREAFMVFDESILERPLYFIRYYKDYEGVEHGSISDKNFGTNSGIAMKYKLQAMSNLEKTKERKFKIGMNRRYKLLFSHPLSKVSADEYVNLNYYFAPNIPANLLEESQIAGNLTGITSQETQLKIISAVDDVQQEIERMEQENDKTGYHTNFPTDRVVSDELLGKTATATK